MLKSKVIDGTYVLCAIGAKGGGYSVWKHASRSCVQDIVQYLTKYGRLARYVGENENCT